MIEIEIQNETDQTQQRIRFAAVPRIGEGIRLRGTDGFWASYDVIDVWYQKAEYGDVWVPYMHVRSTEPAQADASAAAPEPYDLSFEMAIDEPFEPFEPMAEQPRERRAGLTPMAGPSASSQFIDRDDGPFAT